MQCPCGLAGVLAIVTLAAFSQAYEEELEDIFDARPSLRVSLIKNKRQYVFTNVKKTISTSKRINFQEIYTGHQW